MPASAWPPSRSQHRHPQVALEGGVIEHVEHGNSEDDEKDAVPLGQDLSSGSVRQPAVEVVAEKRHEQRKAVDQAVGGGIETTSLQGEDVGQESVDRIVGEEQAGHEEEDLQEIPQLRRFEQVQERRLFDLSLRLGLFEFRRLVEVTPDIERQEDRDHAGHEGNAPAVRRHGFLGSQEGDQGEDQGGKDVTQGEAGLDESADGAASLLGSIFNGKGMADRVFAAEENAHAEAEHAEDDIGPDADLSVGGKESCQEGHYANAADGEDQEEAPADLVGVATEDRRTDRPGGHGDGIGEYDDDVLPGRAALGRNEDLDQDRRHDQHHCHVIGVQHEPQELGGHGHFCLFR